MFDSNSYDTLKLYDAWNKNKKFPSDSYGLVNLKMTNGRQLLHAMSWGYVNKKIRLNLRDTVVL